MATRTRRKTDVPYEFGMPLDTALARRERFANRYDYDYGRERVFPELVEALLSEIPAGCDLLEVGAATGLLTRPLLTVAGKLTAMEPSTGMLRRLLASDVADDPRLSTLQGMVEDLAEDAQFDAAVVTFTPRRGMGLLQLLVLLAAHVRTRVVMLVEDDGSMDWAYLARAASVQGFDVHLHIVNQPCEPGAEPKRAVVMVADVSTWCPDVEPSEAWAVQAREFHVPYPAPRGAATRLVRFFLAGGDSAILIRTDPEGTERLYGNLRTAVHRLGRDEVTVRRATDGIQIVRLPKSGEE